MKQKKKRVILLAACLCLLNMTASFAADGDVWVVATKQKYATARQITSQKIKRREITKAIRNYYYEYKGKLYPMEVVNTLYINNSETFLDELKKESPSMPVPGTMEDLEVISID